MCLAAFSSLASVHTAQLKSVQVLPAGTTSPFVLELADPNAAERAAYWQEQVYSSDTGGIQDLGMAVEVEEDEYAKRGSLFHDITLDTAATASVEDGTLSLEGE